MHTVVLIAIAVVVWLVILFLAPRLIAALLPPASFSDEAERRAEELLRQGLTQSDYERLCRTGFLEVNSRHWPGRTYRIYRRPPRVLVYEKGSFRRYLCAVPIEPLPNDDLVLMHKLLLEADELRYLDIAHSFG